MPTRSDIYPTLVDCYNQLSWYKKIGFWLSAPRLALGLFGYKQSPNENRIKQLVQWAKASWLFSTQFELFIFDCVEASSEVIWPLTTEQIQQAILWPPITIPPELFSPIEIRFDTVFDFRRLALEPPAFDFYGLALESLELEPPTLDESISLISIFRTRVPENRNNFEHYYAQVSEGVFERFKRGINTMKLTDGSSKYQMDDNTPGHYICYITQEIMRDPVFVAPDNRCYEREALQQWYDSFFRELTEYGQLLPRCIINRKINLSNPQELPTNKALQTEIVEYLQQRQVSQNQAQSTSKCS